MMQHEHLLDFPRISDSITLGGFLMNPAHAKLVRDLISSEKWVYDDSVFSLYELYILWWCSVQDGLRPSI